MSPKLNGEMFSNDASEDTKFSAIKQVTSFDKPYESLLSHDSVQMQVDKLALIDMMFGGQPFPESFSTPPP